MKRKYNKIIIDGDIAKIEINSLVHGVHYAIIDIKNIDKIKNYTWFIKKTCKINKFYVDTDIYINDKRTRITLHRLIMNCPKGLEIDHIDNNGLNNLDLNLRICTKKQNQENTEIRKDNKTNFKNVSYHKRDNVYEVKIQHNKKYIWGGRFKNIEEAEKAAIELRQKYFTHSKEYVGI